MRLFVAVQPPDDVLADVEHAVAPARAAQPELRWVPRERWHLTLAFYGEVPDEKLDGVVDMVRRRLARHGDLSPLELSFAGAGQFARRALWVGVSGDVERLRALAKAVATDRRPYRAHLTVARLRGGHDAASSVGLLSSYAGPAWTATHVHLVRSFLGPQPRYETLASWPLGAELDQG